jgi:hypothetical protein
VARMQHMTSLHMADKAPNLPHMLDIRESSDDPDWEWMIWMSQDGEPRKNDIDRENDREPDPPHGHLVQDGWRGF